MEFENEFTVPAPPGEAWDALMDMDRMARCMPGATLMENHDDRLVGRLKVRVGPIKMSYRGTAEFLERDPSMRRTVITAKGREERGAGTAGMKVTASLTPTDGGQTKVHVLTDLDVSGKPAQFGRGMMAEVGTAILDEFATRLADEIRSGERAANAGSVPGPASDRPPTAAVEVPDALDLGGLVGGPLAKRAGLALAVVLGSLAVLLLRHRRPRPAVTVVYLGGPEIAPKEANPVQYISCKHDRNRL